MLDVTKYAPKCKARNHHDRHTDPTACDSYEAEDRARAVYDLTAEVVEHRQTLDLLRTDVKDAETALADAIREAMKYGASATKLAAAANLSRERIYQIRDGRR